MSLCLALGVVVTPARAELTITGPEKITPGAIPPNGSGYSTITWGSSAIGPSDADLTALKTAFPVWTFNVGGPAALNGTLFISDFFATATAILGGAGIELGYDDAAGDPPLKNLEWIQVVTTSDPILNKPNPSVDGGGDPNYNGPPLPFYYSPDQDSSLKAGGVYGFSDYPSRYWPKPPDSPYAINSTTWQADLLLTSWSGTLDKNNNGTVTIHGGLNWGFYLDEYPAAGIQGPITSQAVPEPPGVFTLGLGIILLGVRGPRRRTWIVAAVAILSAAGAVLTAADRARQPRAPFESAGVRLVLKLAGHSFRPGEPIPLGLEYINDSRRMVTLWECRF